MKNYKVFFSILIVFFLFFNATYPVYASSNNVNIYAQYGVAIDAQTGAILYNKGANTRWYPASITKLMTAILMMKYLKPNEKITANALAVSQAASNSLFLMKLHESMTAKDALYALLMISANDVAEAVAQKIAGNNQKFAQLMNEEALKLGAKNTHFENPNGLFQSQHYSTPYDLALIAKKAMSYPQILHVLETSTYTLHTNFRNVTIYNQNKILGQYGVLGGKMGYTSQSGNNLMEIFKRNGRIVIVVVMRTTLYYEYQDTEAVANYAFSHLDPIGTLKIVKKGEVENEIYKKQKVNFVVSKNDFISYNRQASIPRFQIKIIPIIKETIIPGQKIGNLIVYQGGKIQEEIPLLSNQTLNFQKKSLKTWKILLSLGILILGYWLFIVRYNQNKKRKARKKRGAA